MGGARAATVLTALLLMGVAWLFWAYPHYMQQQAAFVLVYAIAGLGMHVIVGQCGQISLGHAALMGLGAYTSAFCLDAGMAWHWALGTALVFSALAGGLAALPAARLGGLYFGMATLAFSLLVEEAFVFAVPLTGGNAGRLVPAASGAGLSLTSPVQQMVWVLLVFGVCLWGVMQIHRARLGRAFRAVRDDERAAAACGVAVLKTKVLAFVLGGALAGVAGALYAQLIGYLNPDQFGMRLSFEMLILVFLGGTRHPLGVLWGASLLIALPQGIVLVRDAIPVIPASAGLESIVFGAAIVMAVLWQVRKAQR